MELLTFDPILLVFWGLELLLKVGRERKNRMFVAVWWGLCLCKDLKKKNPKCLTFHDSFTPTPKRISCRGRSVLLLIASGDAKRKIGRESGIGKRSSNSCRVFCVHFRTNGQGKSMNSVFPSAMG